MFQVTKQYVSGPFAGTSSTTLTNVPFKQGKKYKSCVTRGSYVVTSIKTVERTVENLRLMCKNA